MISKIMSTAVFGLEAYPVQVEVDISNGLPMFTVVGLPDAAVKESRDRVRAALKNTGFDFPVKKITINLAPADIRKEGSAFDLPMAVGILAAAEVIREGVFDDYVIVGELSLDGEVKPVKGGLSMSVAAKAAGKRALILPEENAAEAAVVGGIDVFGVRTLPQVVEFLEGRQPLARTEVNVEELFENHRQSADDFSDVKGQEHAKRALEVAAAGGHNLLMVGPPGSGKTMLSRRLPSILPVMSFEEAIETTRIHSVAGLLPRDRPLRTARPFRAPHHTVSDAGLIGGGQIPKPGEVSLAHNGVLFLDELPEFRRNVLEVLRQPLEEGRVTISRAVASLSYPATFMLVAAMNPCPCGYFTDRTHACRCTPSQIQRYRSRVSGPLLDRIDIHIEVPAVPFHELASEAPREDSASIRKRIEAARAVQRKRLGSGGIHCNAHLGTRLLRQHCKLDRESRRIFELAITRLRLSGRAYSRILKVARTIADLDGSEAIGPAHISEAVQYRTLDRQNGM